MSKHVLNALLQGELKWSYSSPLIWNKNTDSTTWIYLLQWELVTGISCVCWKQRISYVYFSTLLYSVMTCQNMPTY